MSFGFGVGDFIALSWKADKVQRELAGAPIQFKAISDEYAISKWIPPIPANYDIQIDSKLSCSSLKVSKLSITKNLMRAKKKWWGQEELWGNALLDCGSILDELQRLQAKRNTQKETKELLIRINTNVFILDALREQFTRDDNLLRPQEDQGKQAVLDNDSPKVGASATETPPTNSFPTGIKVLYDPVHSDVE